MAQMTAKLQQEKASWESRLQSKENDIKIMKTRLAWRDKRLQDEIARRHKELAALQQTATDELRRAQSRYEAEKQRLAAKLKERRAALTALESQQVKQRQSKTHSDALVKESLTAHRQHLEESVRKLEAQCAELENHYVMQLSEKETQLAGLEQEVAGKDQQLQDTRHKARKISEQLHKEMEGIQHLQTATEPSKGARLAPVWAIFEQAIHHYKAERWSEAAQLFQECIHQDPNWSAAYQYLALVFHALGQQAEAAWAAEQAMEKDPDNARLATWANRLRATLNVKHPPAA